MADKNSLEQVEFDELCGLPKYRQLADVLTVYIQKRALEPGDAMPTIKDYAVLVGISKNTVIRAYEILKKRKLIAAKDKVGYFVLNNQ